MTSVAKIESNQRNAQRSTGPRTRAGKVASSRNSLQHGLLAREMLLPDEDAKTFMTFCKEMADQLAPYGPLEALLVERITASAWRLRRIVRLEAGVLTFRTREAEAELAASQRDGDPLPAGVIRDATGADTLSKLSRYETSLERGLYRALHELQRLQAARTGQAVDAPRVVDVDVSSRAG